MLKRLTFFVASVMMSVASFAQWTKPAAPAVQPMSVGEVVYLYNSEADGFLLGANDWGTRASVSPTLGHKVILEAGTAADSYYITNYVLEGAMKDQWGYMFIDGVDAIWVDNTKDGKANNQYTFLPQTGGTYKIGLSAQNAEFTPSNYQDAYLGLIKTVGDTRLYVCDPENSLGYNMNDCQLIWYFVSEADYTTYSSAMKQYLAAVALGESIAEADKIAGVDATTLNNAKNVYNNTSSTFEQLEAQKELLDKAIATAKMAVATVEDPVNVMSLLGIASDFNDGETTGWTSTTNAQNKQASNGNNAKDYSVTGNHYENWKGDAMAVDGKVYATATNLSAGVYHLNSLAFANSGEGVYLYAGNSQTKVTATKIDIEKPFDVYTYVSGDNLEFGLQIQEKSANWIGLDNVNLFYLGDADDAYELLVIKTMETEPGYAAMESFGELYCQKSVYENYKAALAAFNASATDKAKALADFLDASKAMASSVAAYTLYRAKVSEAEDFLATTTAENDEVNLLADYLMAEDEPGDDYNHNGGSVYILANGLLDDTQIAAETAYLDGIMKNAMANAMSDGDDCTALLNNPKFAETGGWTSAVGPVWPYGNTEVFPVMEAGNMVCDVYQELTNLQNGLYEFNLSAAFRPGDSYTDENENLAKAYAYINSFETKVPSGNIPGVDEAEGITLNEAAEASNAFADGKFKMTVYGLVSDGTMRIGITNKVRSVEGCRLWAGGASLIFRGKNPEVLASVIAKTLPTAEAMLNNIAGQPELNALQAAITASQSSDDAYQALLDLKKAMEDVEEGTKIYANLQVAINSLSDAIANASNASAKALKDAQDLLAEAQTAYNSKSYNSAEAEAAITDLNAAVVALKMGGGGASEDNPVDYSDMIVNNTFDPAKGSKDETRIDGWVTTAMNGYKQYTVSYNRAPFELYQKLSGLPKGKYKVSVHTYYRAGYYDEEETRIKNNEETHLTTLYAKTSEDNFTTQVMNLSEGGADTDLGVKCYTLSNGKFAPDGTTPTAEFFKQGYYLNELVFTVPEDGEVTIGLSKTEVLANDYEVVGEWRLWYMGDEAEVVDVSDLIVNANFDPEKGSKDETRIDGWTTTAMNGYKQYTVSYNRAPFELNQKLSGLPQGKYRVTVHTYYRAGYYDEEETRIKNNEETHLTTLYAKTSDGDFTKPVMNLSEGGADTDLGVKCYTLSNGKFAPDGTTPTAEFFKQGYYLNTLEFTVPADGEVIIGLSKTEVLANDYEVVGEWKLYYLGAAEELVDVSDLIVNANYDPEKGSKDETRIEGWTTTAMNGYKQYSVSYNRAPFELYQDLSGLPAGFYKATVHTYYRAGYYDEEEARVANGEETHLTTLYATTSLGNYTTPVMNLYEGAADTDLDVKCYTLSNGKFAPDGTTPTVAFFAAGYYLNEIEFEVGEDGKARIGLSKTEVLANDYEVVGEWKLYYYKSGAPVAIEGVAAEEISEPAVPVAFFSVSGARLNAPQKGINIVRMSNGTVRKVLVK